MQFPQGGVLNWKTTFWVHNQGQLHPVTVPRFLIEHLRAHRTPQVLLELNRVIPLPLTYSIMVVSQFSPISASKNVFVKKWPSQGQISWPNKVFDVCFLYEYEYTVCALFNWCEHQKSHTYCTSRYVYKVFCSLQTAFNYFAHMTRTMSL